VAYAIKRNAQNTAHSKCCVTATGI